MDTIVVTGCSGRIGRAVIHKYRDQNVNIIGFDIVEPSFSQSRFEFMKVDLTSDESVNQAFQAIRSKYGSTITSVIHLAAYYNFTGGAWELYDKLTIKGSERLLAAAKKGECEQFIFSSSMLAQAPCKAVGQRLTEDDPMSTQWEYPKSKTLAEERLRALHGNTPLVILRIAGCYDDECHSIPISNQIQRIFERDYKARLFPGNLTHGASFIHIDDVAECIIACVKKRAQLPKETILLVGEEDTMSYDEIQREISTCLNGKGIKTYRIPKWVAKIGARVQNSFVKPWMIDLADQHYAVDISRMKKLLAIEPKQSLRKTIPKMIKYLLQDPARFYKNNRLQHVNPMQWVAAE